MTETYPIDETNRLRRAHQRGAHDHATVHALLDAGMLAHIAYVIDGQPYCTPTLYWREGNHLYWHGSSASRMLRQQIKGVPVCLTVTQMDSLVLARSAFHHSVDFRAVMAFGQARLVSDPAAKERALAMMVDRLFPGRTAGLRPMNPQELKATAVVVMEIERASAKVRAAGVVDDEEDYALPIWAERIPLRTVLGASEPCPRLVPGTARPAGLGHYAEGANLDEVLVAAHRATFGAVSEFEA